MANPTAAQYRYFDWVAAHGCLVCGGGASIHHVTHEHCHDAPEHHIGKDHWRVVPLCRGHHQDAPDSYHKLGSNWLFYKAHGINLVIETKRFIDTYRETH